MEESNGASPRPRTPPTFSWFEFLLDDSLLEKELEKDAPGSSPWDLLKLFMFQAETLNAAALAAKPIQPTETPAEETEPQPVKETRKVRALRILALKVAAYLKWDLSLLEENLPLPMVYGLLWELLKMTLHPGTDFNNHKNMDLTELSGHAYFALSLFHRWCSRALVRASFPSRPSKMINVNVPGLLDPTMMAPTAFEMVMKVIHENVGDSVSLLEKILEAERDVTMPTLNCFLMLDEDTDDVTHEWDRGITVPKSEIIAMVKYDLGSFYFFKANYSRSLTMFLNCAELIHKSYRGVSFKHSDPVFLKVPDDKLKSYTQACRTILGMPPTTEASLHERVEHSMRTNHEGLIDLLVEDYTKQELTEQHRLSLENQLAVQPEKLELYRNVFICNAVLQASKGMVVSSQLLDIVKKGKEPILKVLLKTLNDAFKTSTPSQMNNLKNFTRYLVQSLPEDVGISKRVRRGPIAAHLSVEELDQLKTMTDTPKGKVDLLSGWQVPPSGDPEVQTGEIERLLLWTYEPMSIQELINKLSQKHSKFYLTHLSDRWRVSKEMQQATESLPMIQEQVSAHVMVAKARHCLQMKLYKQARQLLQVTESAAKDRSYRLTKLLRWELLLNDLTEYEETGSFSDDTTVGDITKRVKTCITSLSLEQDLSPGQEALEHCAPFLLSCQEWAYLSSLTHTKSGPIELSRLLADLCKDVPVIKSARKAAREFWDSVLHIFTMTTQQKRNASGTSSTIQREANLGLLNQAQFIAFSTRIRDTLTLSILISCLTKLYNIIKDDITIEIASEYTVLWPLTVGSTSNLNVDAVTDAVHKLMLHALKVDPTNPSWLRTQADIHYAASQYASAMKYYLRSGCTASNFFSEPINSRVFDEQVYKRMIRCCNYLRCYTQVAVLCQCVEEVDYTTAFKALQERNSHDAMDAYYDFLWDSTILEFLVNLHTKRGENEKKQVVMQLIGQLELNASNPAEILFQAAETRKSKFFRAMSTLYL